MPYIRMCQQNHWLSWNCVCNFFKSNFNLFDINTIFFLYVWWLFAEKKHNGDYYYLPIFITVFSANYKKNKCNERRFIKHNQPLRSRNILKWQQNLYAIAQHAKLFGARGSAELLSWCVCCAGAISHQVKRKKFT